MASIAPTLYGAMEGSEARVGAMLAIALDAFPAMRTCQELYAYKGTNVCKSKI